MQNSKGKKKAEQAQINDKIADLTSKIKRCEDLIDNLTLLLKRSQISRQTSIHNYEATIGDSLLKSIHSISNQKLSKQHIEELIANEFVPYFKKNSIYTTYQVQTDVKSTEECQLREHIGEALLKIVFPDLLKSKEDAIADKTCAEPLIEKLEKDVLKQLATSRKSLLEDQLLSEALKGNFVICLSVLGYKEGNSVMKPKQLLVQKIKVEISAIMTKYHHLIDRCVLIHETIKDLGKFNSFYA
jgi:hypothetical protein